MKPGTGPLSPTAPPKLWYNATLMGHKSRFKTKLQQLNKRKKKRVKLAKAGKKVDELFHNGTWVGPRKSAA